MNHHAHSTSGTSHTGKNHYGHLRIITVVSFIAMYVLMYAMVNVVGKEHPNLNQ